MLPTKSSTFSPRVYIVHFPSKAEINKEDNNYHLTLVRKDWYYENTNPSQFATFAASVTGKQYIGSTGVDSIRLYDDQCRKSYGIEEEIKGLRNYIKKSIFAAHSEYQREIAGRDCVIAFNLFGYIPTSWTTTDQLFGAIAESLVDFDNLNRESNSIVLFLNNYHDYKINLRSDEQPKELRDFLSNEEIKPRLIITDYKSYETYELSKCGLYKIESINQDLLVGVLKANDQSVKQELLWRTNTRIGHFDLGHSHIRAHYAIDKFTEVVFVREYMKLKLRDAFQGLADPCIIIVGLDQNSLSSVLEEYISLSEYNARVFHQDRIEEVFSVNPNHIILLTDIINSGKTIESLIEEIRFHNTVVSIQVFCIAILRNTLPDKIVDPMSGKPVLLTKLFIIDRDFYDPNDCVLCNLKQPLDNMGMIVSDKTQFTRTYKKLTPYDFWEAVEEQKALLMHELSHNSESEERVRVHTTTIPNTGQEGGLLERNKAWLKAVVADNLQNKFSGEYEEVEIIGTLSEDTGRNGGREFAEIVDLALDDLNSKKTERVIDAVSRHILNTGTSSDISGNPVLLVDDGINTFGTFDELLTKRYPSNRYKIVGGIVFDSQLTERELSIKVEKSAPNLKIASLYQWKPTLDGNEQEFFEEAETEIFKEENIIEQLKLMIQKWDGRKYRYSLVGALLDYSSRVGVKQKYRKQSFNIDRGTVRDDLESLSRRLNDFLYGFCASDDRCSIILKELESLSDFDHKCVLRAISINCQGGTMKPPKRIIDPQAHQFEIAFSFAGEQRKEWIEPIIKELEDLGVKEEDIFYYPWYEYALVGTNKDIMIEDIYKKNSDLPVAILSKEYKRKVWPGIEWRAIRERFQSTKEDGFFITHDINISEITDLGLQPSEDLMASTNEKSPAELADSIYKRLVLIKQRKAEKSINPISGE